MSVKAKYPLAPSRSQNTVPMLLQSPMSQLQSVPIPHLNMPEVELVSGDMAWDNQHSYSRNAMDVTWNYYTLPPSPPASVSSNADESPPLRTRFIAPPFTPESQSSEGEQQSCLPTNQVFDLDIMDAPSPSSSVSPPPPIPRQLTLSLDSGTPLKKSFSTIGGVKKGRGSGERITTKDFVPPDVTGLSKREARLLKNRAAAFLSRQRKREEFEAMEIRVKELEEENSRLQALAERGKKYDDLLLNMEQLRLRLSVAEKRERELHMELTNRSVASMAVKTEPRDLNLPSTSCPSYATAGQSSTITVMKQSFLSSLPSLLSLPPQASLPITFSTPLTDSNSSRPSSASFVHHPTSCDINDQGRPRYDQADIRFHPSSADVESLKNLAIGGEPPEACQFNIDDGLHCLGNFLISLDASSTKDGRGCVRVHVSERTVKPTMHGNGQEPSSLTSWPGADASFAMLNYTSPPLSTPIHTPPASGVDPLGVFGSTCNGHSGMGFKLDTQLMSSGYPPFAQHDPEQAFDYYPGLILE